MSFANRKDIKDFVTDAWRGISVEHNNIHEGYFYEAPLSVDIGASATYVIGFKTPTDTSIYVHYRNEKISTSGDKLTIALQELATITGGTTVSSYNHNRGSSNTANSVVKAGVTLSTAGTTISIAYIGGGAGVGATRAGGETSQENEFVLKQNTQYAIVISNASAGTNTVVVSPQWYEEDAG